MQPTADDFRALARSSPWRWTTLHFRHRSRFPGEAEAWVRRPGELLVSPRGRPTEYVSGVPYSTSSVRIVGNADGTQAVEPDPEPEPEPVFRADGLVESRPDGWGFRHSDPIWGNYSWPAMLDPEELSHHVDVADLRVVEVAGRTAWRADLRAGPGYDPRCGGNCCELLYSEAGLRADFPDPDDVPEKWRGRDYPDHYDVALDVGTGVVVRCLPVGGPDDAPWLENDVLEVDADLDAVFAGR
ncbi:hypothetical protein [Nocardioides cynanchi]|uniref:hypothetical protein n=1 Tax=Nocardioides cynanchi TaxID=2558918 RepID=UPI00124893A5|nr:hypothetical protein [Nocardioides cynanchi]